MADQTVLFDVCHFEVFEMLSDTPGASAGPTYGSAIDVPGVSGFSGFDSQIVSAELKGDCRIMARQGRVDAMNANFEYSKLALNVLNAIKSGLLWTAGLQEGFRMKGGSKLQYFKARAVITGTDAGVAQAEAILYKCQITSETVFDQTVDNYGKPKFAVQAIGIDAGEEDPDDELEYPAIPQNLMADIIITAAA